MTRVSTVLILLAVLGLLLLGCSGSAKLDARAAATDTARATATATAGQLAARIAEHVATYGYSSGGREVTLNYLCALVSSFLNTGATREPSPEEAHYYQPVETIPDVYQYWIAETSDPQGEIWTVSCVGNVITVTEEGKSVVQDPWLTFLYDATDKRIYPDEPTVVGLMDQVGEFVGGRYALPTPRPPR